MSASRPSRRTLLRTTAWTAPSVVLVTAAPAVATTAPLPSLVYDGGSTGLVRNSYGISTLNFNGASLLVPTDPTTPATLTLTVTLNGGADYLWSSGDSPGMPGWTCTRILDAKRWGYVTVVYTRTTPVTAAGSYTIPYGFYFGTSNSAERGTFELVFSANGYASTAAGYTIAG